MTSTAPSTDRLLAGSGTSFSEVDLSVIPGQDVATARRTIGALVEHVLPAVAS